MRIITFILCFTFTLNLHAQRSDFKTISFEKADHIAIQYEGEDLYNLPVLSLRLTAQLDTDVEKFRAIYYWVTHNIKGSYHLTSTNAHKQRKYRNDSVALTQWNNQIKKEVFSQLREDKETLCTGYAYLIKELANLAGIESEIIHGYGNAAKLKSNTPKIPNHSWNAVKLDGTWYVCDATWSSGIIDMGNYTFEFKFNDIFFLMEPSEFAKSHTPVDEKWLLINLN